MQQKGRSARARPQPSGIAAGAMLRVDVLAFDGVLDAALGITLDVLGAANRVARAAGRAEPFSFRLVGMRRRVRTGAGLSFGPVTRLGPGLTRDVLVVLGMNVPARDEVAAALARADVRASLPIIARAAVRGQRVWASCSGTFVLAEAGLLDGRACTTSWWLAPLFRQRYPRAELTTDAMVVPAGAIVTAGAALAQVDLMLRLVRETAGASVAELCTRYLMLDERPSQGRYLVHDQLAHHDDAVRRAEDFARRALHRPIGVLDLAAAAGVSARTLERRVRAALGLSPVALLQRLRVEVAVHRLATTREPLADIATRVGYADPETLARLVRRHTGRSPREIRPQTGRPKP